MGGVKLTNIDMNWKEAKNSEIIKHIRSEHHKFLQEILPGTEERVYKILRVHYEDAGEVLTKVHRLFGRLNNILELLFVKKQMATFPNIVDYERNPSPELLEVVLKDIEDMEKEYDEIVEILSELRKVTNDYTVPPSGCPTFDTTYEMLEELEVEILKNMHLERDIMYSSLKK